jgi:hypothetical protein
MGGEISVIAWLNLATLVMQIFLAIIIGASAWYAIKTRRSIGATLEALHAYRREVAWFEARLDALEKKNAFDPNRGAKAAFSDYPIEDSNGRSN